MNTIPDTWRIAPFSEFLTRVDRKVMVSDQVVYNCVGVRWYGMGAFIREKVPGANISRKQQWVIKEGDIVYNKLFAWKGAFAIADHSIDGSIVSDKFPTYVANPELIDPLYLMYYFHTQQVADQAGALSKGAAAISKLTLNPPQFWKLTIPLPPLKEQQQIVGRIKRLHDKLKEVGRLRHSAIDDTSGLVDSEMNRILTTAASEKSWEFGPIPLFAQINPSRARQINLMQSDLVTFVPMKAVDEVTGTIAWPETRPFSEVATGYTWFREGDVIFARITPCMQNGKSAIARGLENGTAFGSTEFHVIRPGPKLTAEWLHALVRYKAFRDDAASRFKGTAGQQRVPQNFLEQKIIPVPPIAAQHSLVEYLSKVSTKVADLKRLQIETLKEINAVLPSILDHAFKGDL